MEIQIIEEKENPLLKRKEILATIDYQGGATPSKAELQKVLADKFKANIDSVEITKLLSEVGISKGKAWIKIWQEKKVPIYSELKKEKKKEEPKKAPKPEAPKPEEKPEAEIKPEEPKVEPKKEEKKEEKPQEQPKEQKQEEVKEEKPTEKPVEKQEEKKE
jgi:ribosomal protein S24E